MPHVWSEETCSLPCVVRPLYSNGLDFTIAKIHSQPMWMRATVHRACAVKSSIKANMPNHEPSAVCYTSPRQHVQVKWALQRSVQR